MKQKTFSSASSKEALRTVDWEEAKEWKRHPLPNVFKIFQQPILARIAMFFSFFLPPYEKKITSIFLKKKNKQGEGKGSQIEIRQEHFQGVAAVLALRNTVQYPVFFPCTNMPQGHSAISP